MIAIGTLAREAVVEGKEHLLTLRTLRDADGIKTLIEDSAGEGKLVGVFVLTYYSIGLPRA